MITETSPILSLLFAKGLGVRTLSQLVDRIVEDELSVEDIISQPPDILVQRFGLRLNVAEAIQAAHEPADRLAQELEEHGVQILVRGIEPYPTHLVDVLGSNAPPVLFVRGDLSVLSRKAVGFCGARSASEKGIRVASESAHQLAEHDVNVVSGYAKGVDLAAHRAAMESGGVTTIVLAEGILHFRPKREVKSFLDDYNHLVVSEYSPRLPWSGRNAMQRNKTIIGLSDAVICIESGMKGGTYAAAESTLALNLPLFVADYAQPAESAAGNQHFISRGATPLRGDRTGTPNLKRVFDAIGMATPTESGETTNCKPCASPVAKTMAPARKEKDSMPKVESSSKSDSQNRYPKRLIEVDLPIARISAHARREKSIRHGHISTLHIWWARRPLAACRAVICASLWPDPADELCPPAFREAAVEQIKQFASRVFPKKITAEGRLLSSEKHCSPESRARWEAIAAGTLTLDANEPADLPMLRMCLLDFIADFANWDNSTVPAYLETSRALTAVAHQSLSDPDYQLPPWPDGPRNDENRRIWLSTLDSQLSTLPRPLVVDPFAGGGSIPLEALRVGADTFASDLNPVAVLLNKVVLEYIPKYGQRLADEVRKAGLWIKEHAEQELAEFYPKDIDGATPIAYLWARTILSEAAGQGHAVEVPVFRSMWLSKGRKKQALRWCRDANGEVQTQVVDALYADGTNRKVRRPELEIFEPSKDSDVVDGTVTRGSVTCPITGYTTPVSSVRTQLKERQGGTRDARLLAVVLANRGNGKSYRLATKADIETARRGDETLRQREAANDSALSVVPDEVISLNEIRRISLPIYGMTEWGHAFSARQSLVLATLGRCVREAPITGDPHEVKAVRSILALAVDRQADFQSSLVTWTAGGEFLGHTFTRQALGMVWDFAEGNPWADTSGNWNGAIGWICRVLEHCAAANFPSGTIQQASATEHPLPDDSASALVTDPPYYDAVPYSHLSDYFYVWLRRTLQDDDFEFGRDEAVPKADEIVVDRPHSLSTSTKGIEFYETNLQLAFADARRVVEPSGVGTIVFASKSTASWEAILQAVVDAGWTITASWPIDTEREARIAAQGQARLASSIHLVCRPRENESGELREEIGEWRDVLSELPKRIHEWMPRLAAEGVVGADAIFACLGPALEIFSRYSRVEKASGEAVPLREYLEQVWATVSTEALSMIFNLPAPPAGRHGGRQGTADPSAAGLEPDARLTAMWLWTLGGMANNRNGKKDAADEKKIVASTGYTLEFDAARKIAQGLGIHLEQSETIVEVKGDKARLLPCSERTRYLFGKDEATAGSARGRKKKKPQQRSLFEELDELEAEAEASAGELKPQAGETVLDRVHQSMILFASGRGEALRRFLVEDGAGTDARFWKLAQSLSALYPKETDEKRWVDGVLARKKGLGL